MPSPHMRVLVDTNVVLDVLLAREPFLEDALGVFASGEAGALELLLSTDAISTVFYIVRKNQGAAAAREAVAKLLDMVRLVALDERAVMRAMLLDFTDLEDALVVAVAEREGARLIVTRNGADFANSPVPAVAPGALLALLAAQGAGGQAGVPAGETGA